MEKEKLPAEREPADKYDILYVAKNFDETSLKSIIHVITDIKDCLRSDRPADDYLTRWEEHNAEVPDARSSIRAVYADELEKAELILKKLL